MAEAIVFLQIEPQWHSPWSGAEPRLNGIKVAAVTQKRPARPKGPVVKLTLRIPDVAFKPLEPEVVIEVPEDRLDYTTQVTVEVPEAAS